MSTSIGHQAEAVAAEFLQRQGHRLLERNWRTRWCEIDLVTQKDTTVYFVEVKYRRRDAQGGGLDYITHRKLQQMHFAADYWLAKHARQGYEYRLAAIELAGDDFTVTAWLDEL